jgi:hypothetical protein
MKLKRILIPSLFVLSACNVEQQQNASESKFIGTTYTLDRMHEIHEYTPVEAPDMLCVVLTSRMPIKAASGITCFKKI